jgi:uncharacterized membrane protein YcaP (DUF421 family)
MATFYSGFLGKLVKGEENLLVENGSMKIAEMKKTNISEKDLMEALRNQGVENLKDVKKAFLERSGKISVISD